MNFWRLISGSSSALFGPWLELSALLAPFIAKDTAAVVAAGESTPSGEDSGVRVAVVTKGSGKGLGNFGT